MPLPQIEATSLSSSMRRKVRVGLVQQVCTAYRARFFERLSKRFSEKGYELTVFFGKPQRGLTYSGIIPDPKSSEFRFKYKVLPKVAYEGKLPTSPFHLKRALVFFPTLVFEIGNGRYDVTISDTTGEPLNTFPLFFINKLLLGKKFVVWCGNNIKDNAPKPSDSLIKKVVYVFAGFIYRHCDASITYGPASKSFDIYMGTPANKIFIALNTVDTLYFEEVIKARRNEMGKLREKLGISDKACALYVGVLEKRKKLENLILAFKEVKQRVKNAALLLVGDGPHKESLQNLVTKEKIQDVFFLGKIDYEDIPLYYALSEVFVLPAQGGIAVAEAMACGKPVIITSECNALRSIPNLMEDGENGFILKEDDISSLSQHIIRVLSDPSLARKMGAKSKERAERYFSTEKMIRGFEQAMDYVTSRLSAR